MRDERWRGLWVAALVMITASAQAETSIDDPALRTVETRLDNGLTVLTLEDHTTPVVSFQMWVRVGSRDEARLTGLAHLFEHMMFKGSAAIGPEEHGRLIASRGGRSNAYTTRDVTVYTAEVTSQALPLVIALEAERVANLDVTESTLDSEREVVIEERRMRTDDSPVGKGLEALFSLVFQAHPYRWPVIGWASDIANSTVAACHEFFEAYYVPNNITLVIVGDFDSEDTLEQIEQAFGPLRAVPSIPRNTTEEPKQDGVRRSQVHFDVRSPTLAMAWRAPRSGHADSESLDVLSQILSGGRSSRLYRRLIYTDEVALSAHGGYWELADAGVFYAYASIRPGESVERVEDLLLEEIAKLRDGPVDELELEKAKQQIEVSMVRQLSTNRAVANRIGYDATVLGRIRPLVERLAAIQAVSVADVQRVARDYLRNDRRNVVQVVPKPDDTADGGES
jgi:zinc protease